MRLLVLNVLNKTRCQYLTQISILMIRVLEVIHFYSTEITSSCSHESLSCSESSPSKQNNCKSQIFDKVSKSFLHRLIESKLFDMSMAITYLFNSKEPGVQRYIGDKLFSFDNNSVDIYLPQLITMYIQMDDIAEAIDSYLVHRCRKSCNFSIKCAWLLNAFNVTNVKNKSHGGQLITTILNEHYKQGQNEKSNFESMNLLTKKTHCRSRSDSSMVNFSGIQIAWERSFLGDLSSGMAFDNGCTCTDQNTKCQCGAPRMSSEIEFIKCLIALGRDLTNQPSKESKTTYLYSQLSLINKNLPAKVWIPLYNNSHHVLAIPPRAAAVLNSKDKAPFVIYVEVAEVEDAERSPLTTRVSNIRQSRSAENLIRCESEVNKPEVNKNMFIVAGDIRRRLTVSTDIKSSSTTDPEDPSAAALKELWSEKEKRVRENSPYGSLINWKLLPVIIKTGDDLRQELLASQLLLTLHSIWLSEKVPLQVFPYRILCLSNDAGLIEPVLNTVSLHQIKKQNKISLLQYFEKEFKENIKLTDARQNFIHSCAAYSLVCYLIQVKDRHNGNILLDNQGNLIHIDFGFILSASPKNLGFESSPFKLTSEMVDVMGGLNSEGFKYFKKLILKGLIASRKHMDRVLSLVQIMQSANSQLPCFKAGATAVIGSLKCRFHLNLTESQLITLVDNMVESSLHSITTKLYDGFQYYTNGIL
ncbi:phosphatidylinositol 4-kinase beta isoform X2 [Daktulosphaira vitifoliae]|uniref:phosphatidylinositol 4-kinase beta isoform X2 n=1 Tax=Daktulosphaira vitifoliae TaxID=58002 RepID=UPI0021AA3958|nr:phosphatidylinositol 4-kinase beta isoform X2 [Daktulosphaira vitifoliae]